MELGEFIPRAPTVQQNLAHMISTYSMVTAVPLSADLARGQVASHVTSQAHAELGAACSWLPGLYAVTRLTCSRRS